MTILTGLGVLLIEFVKTLVIDSVLKVIIHPDKCIVPQIKIGGPMLGN